MRVPANGVAQQALSSSLASRAVGVPSIFADFGPPPVGPAAPRFFMFAPVAGLKGNVQDTVRPLQRGLAHD